jgi:hypothetical protein
MTPEAKDAVEVYITRVTKNTATAQINHPINMDPEYLKRRALQSLDYELAYSGRHAERGAFTAVEITTKRGFRGRTRSTVKIVRKQP